MAVLGLFAPFFLVAVVGLGIYFVILYNGLVALRNDVNRAWANIDVLLKQRFDLLPNLVEVCKGYMNYERDTLERVVQARNVWSRARSVGEKIDANHQSTAPVNSLLAVAENYPQLKANQVFLDLAHAIQQLELQIADRRELYNDAANILNTRIGQLPDCWVAQLLSYIPAPFFAAGPEERKPVSVGL